MQSWRKYMTVTLLFLIPVLVSCAADQKLVSDATPTVEQPKATATPLPAITISDREELIIGVDSAFPPFADLDDNGDLIGVEVDIFAALADIAGIDYQLVSADYDTLFADLVAGRFDAVFGGISMADAPDQLVDLTEPIFQAGQVVVVLDANEEIERLSDLENAQVGVEPLSWGEFAVLGPDAFFPLPDENLVRFASSPEMIQALFDGLVDAIITHHTVIDSYVSINPGYLRILPARAGDQVEDGWLSTHQYHIAVPKGADQLLEQLDTAIDEIKKDGGMDAIFQAWSYRPQFAERPRFAQDASADSLVAGIEKVDDLTVRFVLNRPDPNFDYKMTVPVMAIHSPTNLDEYGGGAELAQHPVGTGPYMMASWDPSTQITLTANLDYWGDLALIDTVVITAVPDAGQRPGTDERRR